MAMKDKVVQVPIAADTQLRAAERERDAVRAELEREKATGASRVRQLERLAGERITEWQRAENAESEVSALRAACEQARAALRESQHALEFARQHMPGGDPILLLHEGNENLVLRRDCIPRALRTIETVRAALASVLAPGAGEDAK